MAWKDTKTGKRLNSFFPGIFTTLLGLIAVIMGIWSMSNYISFSENPDVTEIKAVVSHIKESSGKDKSKVIYVQYECNDKEYTRPLNYYTAFLKKGDEITVYVDKSNPNDFYHKTAANYMIPMGMGLVFAAVGAWLIIDVVIYRKQLKGNESTPLE